MGKNRAIKRFTATGSWTAPAGVTEVTVRAWGGGAGGCNNDYIWAQAAGSSVEIVKNLTVVPNTAYTVTIGAGGTAGTSVAAAGDGGDTTFGSLATAVGCTSTDSMGAIDTTRAQGNVGFNTYSGYRFSAIYGQELSVRPNYNVGNGFNGPGGVGGVSGMSYAIYEIPSTSVNVGTDTITAPEAHESVTGDPVRTLSGDHPAPIGTYTIYYLIKVSATEFQLATSYANAIALTNITLTDAGTGNPDYLIDPSAANMAITTAPAANTGGGGATGGHGGTSVSVAALDGTAGGSGYLEITWEE